MEPTSRHLTEKSVLKIEIISTFVTYNFAMVAAVT